MPKAPPSLFQNCAPEYVAVVLASSTGSRLFPITSSERLPKHLLPVAGIPVISRLLTAIEASGFQECVVVLAHNDKVTVPHLKSDLVVAKEDENDASGANNKRNTTTTNCTTKNYQITSNKPNLLVLESAIYMKITVISLQEDCQGSIGAVRKVEEMGPTVVPATSNMVVLPGDLVVLDSSIISKLCDAHRQGYHNNQGKGAIKMSTACTVLLTDVGEQDEQGVPLKESAKQKKGGLARDEEDIEYIALSYRSTTPAAPRLVWKQLKMDVHDKSAGTAETPKLQLPKPRLRVGDMTRVRTDWNDVHVYVFSPWVRRLIVERKTLLTIQGDLLPLLISRQFQGIAATFGGQVEEERIQEILLKSPDLVAATDDLAGPIMDGDGLGAGPMSTRQSKAAHNEYAVLAHIQDEAVRAYTISSYLHASRVVLTQASEEEPAADVPKKNPCLQLPPDTSVRSKFHSILLPGTATGDKVSFKSATVGRNCKLGTKCRLNNVVIMDNVTIGDNVILQNSIVGANCTLGDNCNLNDCQVAPGTTLSSGEKAKGETFS